MRVPPLEGRRQQRAHRLFELPLHEAEGLVYLRAERERAEVEPRYGRRTEAEGRRKGGVVFLVAQDGAEGGDVVVLSREAAHRVQLLACRQASTLAPLW